MHTKIVYGLLLVLEREIEALEASQKNKDNIKKTLEKIIECIKK